ncbi:MAG TPA: hypothetical protein VFA26_14980 [Gemmataceae bacterium]|nr:hypothetical protein [Gemmataceae bacterium]
MRLLKSSAVVAALALAAVLGLSGRAGAHHYRYAAVYYPPGCTGYSYPYPAPPVVTYPAPYVAYYAPRPGYVYYPGPAVYAAPVVVRVGPAVVAPGYVGPVRLRWR